MNKIFRKIKEYYNRYTKTNIQYAKTLGVQIGDNCRIYIRDFGSEPWMISIGSKVTITHGVRFINHDGSTWLVEDEKGRRQLFRKIIIGSNVFIGMNSILMPGVKIGDNVIVAAGTIVTKSIPSGYVIGGNPAKIITDFNSYKKRVLEEYACNSDMDFSKNYKDRVNEILDTTMKSEIKTRK